MRAWSPVFITLAAIAALAAESAVEPPPAGGAQGDLEREKPVGKESERVEKVVERVVHQERQRAAIAREAAVSAERDRLLAKMKEAHVRDLELTMGDSMSAEVQWPGWVKKLIKKAAAQAKKAAKKTINKVKKAAKKAKTMAKKAAKAAKKAAKKAAGALKKAVKDAAKMAKDLADIPGLISTGLETVGVQKIFGMTLKKFKSTCKGLSAQKLKDKVSELINKASRGVIRVDYQPKTATPNAKYPTTCFPKKKTKTELGESIRNGVGMEFTAVTSGLKQSIVDRLKNCMGQTGATLHLCQVMTAQYEAYINELSNGDGQDSPKWNLKYVRKGVSEGLGDFPNAGFPMPTWSRIQRMEDSSLNVGNVKKYMKELGATDNKLGKCEMIVKNRMWSTYGAGDKMYVPTIVKVTGTNNGVNFITLKKMVKCYTVECGGDYWRTSHASLNGAKFMTKVIGGDSMTGLFYKVTKPGATACADCTYKNMNCNQLVKWKEGCPAGIDGVAMGFGAM